MADVQSTRKFKRVNLLGLDFYVDWLDINDKCERIISVKEVYSGKTFVYKDIVVDGNKFEDMVLEKIGVTPYVKVVAEAPAAQETEQPKENTSAKKAKRSNKSSKE